MIRSFEPTDLDELKCIHEKYFKNQFNFPDFMNYICVFVIEDSQGIITAGGIRDIAECTALTNMSRSPTDRIKALYQLLDASTFVCRKVGYDQMYVWSQNSKYTKRLMKNKFRPPQGQTLILDL
jgi:hypothetical protein